MCAFILFMYYMDGVRQLGFALKYCLHMPHQGAVVTTFFPFF